MCTTSFVTVATPSNCFAIATFLGIELICRDGIISPTEAFVHFPELAVATSVLPDFAVVTAPLKLELICRDGIISPTEAFVHVFEAALVFEKVVTPRELVVDLSPGAS